jgi:hypothetical protein
MFRHNHLLVCHLAARVIPLLGHRPAGGGTRLAHETDKPQSQEKSRFGGAIGRRSNPLRLSPIPVRGRRVIQPVCLAKRSGVRAVRPRVASRRDALRSSDGVHAVGNDDERKTP